MTLFDAIELVALLFIIGYIMIWICFGGKDGKGIRLHRKRG